MSFIDSVFQFSLLTTSEKQPIPLFLEIAANLSWTPSFLLVHLSKRCFELVSDRVRFTKRRLFSSNVITIYTSLTHLTYEIWAISSFTCSISCWEYKFFKILTQSMIIGTMKTKTAIATKYVIIGSKVLVSGKWAMMAAIPIKQIEYSESEITWARSTLKLMFCSSCGTSITRDWSYSPPWDSSRAPPSYRILSSEDCLSKPCSISSSWNSMPRSSGGFYPIFWYVALY